MRISFPWHLVLNEKRRIHCLSGVMVYCADPGQYWVCAIYHDAGKAMNPAFFIENQMPGKTNPHNDLSPEESAEIIIAHVKNGEILANKYHLPSRIVDFMREHHGNLITKYQYAKALQAAGNQSDLINENKFRYPGPKPRSKETALLMLADGCEARARAEMPKNEEELRLVVKKVIDYCLREGQFDRTNLTFRDINLASESIVKTLQNSYHPRLQYPEIKPQNQN
jgi:putative nucleotidyltransferase with HDIG domain